MIDVKWPPGVTVEPTASLEGWVDMLRAQIVNKVSGLGDELSRHTLVSSPTTPYGIVQHLASVEKWWFHHVLGGIPREQDNVASGSWTTTATAFNEVVDAYVVQCDRSRASGVGKELVTRAGLNGFEGYDYGWILGHMIEESARHLGHLDILCEQLDGRIG